MIEKIPRKIGSEFQRDAFTIGLVGILAWGLVVASDYILWDTAYFAHYVKDSARWDIIEHLCRDGGVPLSGVLIKLFTHASNPIAACKAVSVGLWVTSAILFSIFLQKAFGLERTDSTLAACVGVAVPFYDPLGELSLFPYTAAVFLFWLSWVLVVVVDWQITWSSGIRRLLVLGLLFVSFNLGSNLPYTFAILAGFLARKLFLLPRPWDARCILRLGLQYLDLAVCPVVFWVWKTNFTPTDGWYKSIKYNSPSFKPDKLLSGFANFQQSLMLEILEAFSSTERVLAGILVSGLVWWALRRSAAPRAGRSPAGYGLWVAFSVLLVLSAAFAYVAVGQLIAASGWNTRNAILINFPVALCVVTLSGAFQGIIFKRASWFQKAVCVFIIGISVVGCNISTLRYQGLWAKHTASLPKLRSLIAETGVNAVSLRDQLEVKGVIERYPAIVWTFLVADEREQPRVLVVDTQIYAADQVLISPAGSRVTKMPVLRFDAATMQQLIEFTSMDYALSEIPKVGTTLSCVVKERTPSIEGGVTGCRYLFLKYFRPRDLTSFLESLTTVSSFGSDGTIKSL
jgi:hypothetical protein